MGDDCLSNKSVCQTICCKTIEITPLKVKNGRVYFEVPLLWYKRDQKYYDLHGLRKEGIRRGSAVVSGIGEIKEANGHSFFYRVCDALEEETGKCTLHGTGLKPYWCEKGYNEIVDNLVWFKECVYKDKMPKDGIFVSIEQLRR